MEELRPSETSENFYHIEFFIAIFSVPKCCLFTVMLITVQHGAANKLLEVKLFTSNDDHNPSLVGGRALGSVNV
jgi:hypothetical protein